MSTINFANLQKKRDNGDLTIEECRELGRTHAAYHWAASHLDGPQWSEEQRRAYKQAHRDYKEYLSE
jgi:hypothetical protein